MYRTACETCHGQTLEGSDLAPPIQGEVFLQTWDGEVLAELMMFVQETMPQNSPGELTEVDYADIVAFIRSSNGFPLGEELTMASMEDIVIATEE